MLFGHTHPVIPVANKSSTVYFRRFIQSQSSGNRPGQFSRYISRCDIPTDIPTARFGGSNTSGGQIIRTGAKRHTKTPAKWATGSLSLGVKRPGRGVNHQPPSSAEVKERVEVYLYPLLCFHGRLYSEKGNGDRYRTRNHEDLTR